jgi:outer membrane receptor protein involved in Fe transport
MPDAIEGRAHRRSLNVPVEPRAALAACVVALLAATAPVTTIAQPAPPNAPVVTLPPVSVVGVAPLPGLGVDRDVLPYTVQTSDAAALRQDQTTLAEHLLGRFSGVNASDIQGSPFQPDVSFRGYSASSLLGAPQGISVYLDGVRFNAPFGDVVNWDLIPEAALARLMIVPGSNPVYGLNTLGGALVLTTQSGLTAPGFDAEVRLGSFGRKRADLAYGYNNADGWHAFIASTLFDEDGWREHSNGRLGNVFAKVGHIGRADEFEGEVLYGTSTLIGNGLAPDVRYTDGGTAPGLIDVQRDAVYTWPDQTRNRLLQFSVRARHAFDDDTVVDAMAYARKSSRDTVNGDVSDAYSDYADACAAGFAADGTPVSADCPYTREQGAALSTGALNTTQTRERSWGVAVNFAKLWHAHRLAVGGDFNAGRVNYSQFVELGSISGDREVVADAAQPVDFFSGVTGASRALGLYATDTWSVLPQTHVTAALRWNVSRVSNTLSTADGGTQPEAAYVYRKLNPALGIAQQLDGGWTAYANVSQSNRVPTVIELGCADPAQPCRLPAGLQSDPFLQQVVARTAEAGVRWHPSPVTRASVAVYRTDNRDDILFLRAPNTQQGYFANFARTRNQGVDAGLDQQLGPVALTLRYSFLDATYQAQGTIASGERTVDVQPGMRIAGLPRNTFKVAADWQVSDAASVGADVVAQSGVGTVGNEDGFTADPGEGSGGDPRNASVAGHAVVNLRARWRIDDHVEILASIANLFDARYDAFGALGQDLFPGGRILAPHVEPQQPAIARFVAPGAPRAFYLGLRYRY